MPRIFRPHYTRRQTQALRSLDDANVMELLYGGAKGGGKSVFACFWTVRQSLRVIDKYNLPRTEYPLPVGFMGRKVAKDFRETTLETFKMFIPPSIYELKGKPEEIIIDGRVKVITGGLDTEKVEIRNKFNSAQYCFFVIDQAEETTEKDIGLLRAATFGRQVINGEVQPGKGLYTANPAQCWLKGEFISNPAPGRKFVQALPGDNPYLGEQYIDNLKYIFRNRPELLEAYLYGSWQVMADPDQIIRPDWLRCAAERTIWSPAVQQVISCDCARFGDDETVIYVTENGEIVHDPNKYCLAQTSVPDIANRLAVLKRQYPEALLVVESVGSDLGAGVIDTLIEMGIDVTQFNPAAEAIDKKSFRNLRAEAWHYVANRFADGQIVWKNQETSLVDQLCTPKYKFKRGRMYVEPKADIKERLGRSPDRADSYVINIWALQYAPPMKEQKTRYRRRKQRTPESPMIC